MQSQRNYFYTDKALLYLKYLVLEREQYKLYWC